MQLRVVTDQPWDVKADVLAIPIVGEPAFDGPLGELDRRIGGELEALAAFGELAGKRFTRRPSRARASCPRAGVVTVSAGDAAKLDRETVVHVGAAAEHRLGGRQATTLAVWSDAARRRPRRRRDRPSPSSSPAASSRAASTRRRLYRDRTSTTRAAAASTS